MLTPQDLINIIELFFESNNLDFEDFKDELIRQIKEYKEDEKSFKEAFKFFTHENIVISLDPAQIIIEPLNENHLISEEKFYEFHRIIRRMYFIEQDGDEIVIEANDSPNVRALKEQMRANRAKVRKAKAKQAL